MSTEGEAAVWVSCSAREFPASGHLRHLIVAGRLTTLCGHSANQHGIWRRDSRKPQCPYCVKQTIPT